MHKFCPGTKFPMHCGCQVVKLGGCHLWIVAMPFRLLINKLFNNEKTIRQLAESAPIKRAAQIAVGTFLVGKSLGARTMKEIKASETGQKLQKDATSLLSQAKQSQNTFTEEAKRQYKDLRAKSEEMQKDTYGDAAKPPYPPKFKKK